MNDLLNNKEKALQFGKNAKEIAKKDFSKDEYYDKIIKIYKGVQKNVK